MKIGYSIRVFDVVWNVTFVVCTIFVTIFLSDKIWIYSLFVYMLQENTTRNSNISKFSIYKCSFMPPFVLINRLIDDSGNSWPFTELKFPFKFLFIGVDNTILYMKRIQHLQV